MPVQDAEEMTCQELVELVTEYFEGTLSPLDVKRFEDHLRTCDGCQIYLEQMRQLIGALGGLSEETIPEKAKTELLKVFRGWRASRLP